MSLIDRLSGNQEPKIPVHQFWASFVELSLGQITEAQMKSVFGLTGGDDLTEWNWLKGKYDASANKEKFLGLLHSLFILAEQSLYGYDLKATMQTRINAIG